MRRSSTFLPPRQLLHAAWRDVARFILTPLAVLWLLELVDRLLLPAPGLDVYGIRPHARVGLRGILLAPWLHHGFAHLAANTVPLALLGTLVLSRGRRELARVTAWVVLLGGLGVWLIGSARSVHLGASGVVFGYFGYLLALGWFERRAMSILVSLGIAAVYGSLLLGVLPGTPGVSWESHLCGLGAGLAAARRARRGDAT